VNLHGRGPQSHGLLRDTAPRRTVAFACPAAGHQGPAWKDDEHEVTRWCRLVEESFAVPADPGDLLLAVPESLPPVEGSVIVHPGAAYPSRRWPADRFARVARWAASRGWPVVVTGSASELALAEEVRRTAGLPKEAVLAGRTDLTALAALVAAARLVVCGDTGMSHLASAFRTPSVVLFGPVAPRLWGPPAGGPHVAIWHGTPGGDPWGKEVDPALLAISVEEVVERAAALTGVTPARG
jgi:ADP-heptose:LPS heptosyltransferase